MLPNTLASQLNTPQVLTAGTLPDSWMQLPDLQTLHVSGNRLNGMLPEGWQSGMRKLTTLRLKFNNLTYGPS